MDPSKGPKHWDSCVNKINDYGSSIKYTTARNYAEKKLREVTKKYYKIRSGSKSNSSSESNMKKLELIESSECE